MAWNQKVDKAERIKQRAALYRQNPNFARWAAGYGVIRHDDRTQTHIYKMADHLHLRGVVKDPNEVLDCLHAADRIASAGMWLVAHMTYARNVYLDGRDLDVQDFKAHPDGHTGGALNVVLAYTGYLAINAITGITRSWLMGQGHCVAGIDATNLIVGNMTAAHAQRYKLSDAGLTRLVRDFYLQKVRPDGYPESPLGSHVNAYTAGGMMEGGYLGFAELCYAHMPLPGERLVAFLSDGAFEEQKGGDWAPRWWRTEDSGLIAPIMIANGRRIDQRTTVSMEGGVDWFRDYLQLHGFEPFDIDGRDPAAYAWAIWEMEERLQAHGDAVRAARGRYPVPLPYAIAEVPKGFGFPGAGTNAAHNLPVGKDIRGDAAAQQQFNTGARQIWVPLDELKKSVVALTNHTQTKRPLERDNPLSTRHVVLPQMPAAEWHEPGEGRSSSAMRAIDGYFCKVVQENPHLRPRVGNPDEIKSNRLYDTLDLLRHRVTDPEESVAESIEGKIITALNEEAVVCAALANKGGISLVASYEAFAVKMLGAIRQELIFARHQREAGNPPGWLGVPVIVTSHTWENGKNEQSHQDPTLCQALMDEMSDSSRVLFPADWNTATAALQAVYQSHGQIWTLVVAKRPTPEAFTAGQARDLVRDGAITVQSDEKPQVLLSAIGSYQLAEVLRASEVLRAGDIPNRVVYLMEPGKFRYPRDPRESEVVADEKARRRLFPDSVVPRVFVNHTRPEPIAGVLRPLDTGSEHTRFLGYLNRGGTFDVFGMLYANRCTWGHIVAAAAEVLKRPLRDLLDVEEIKAVQGRANPEALIWSRQTERESVKTG
jgi:phosphoketolase